MGITKNILEQYCDMKAELKDLQKRIEATENKMQYMLDKGVQVSDSVTGTREDGTIGPIRITGFPMPEYERLQKNHKKRIKKLKYIEAKLNTTLQEVENFIDNISESELRLLFRMYYLDDMTWQQVASNMNSRFPKRKYTEDNCRMKHNRYLKKIKKNS